MKAWVLLASDGSEYNDAFCGVWFFKPSIQTLRNLSPHFDSNAIHALLNGDEVTSQHDGIIYYLEQVELGKERL